MVSYNKMFRKYLIAIGCVTGTMCILLMFAMNPVAPATVRRLQCVGTVDTMSAQQTRSVEYSIVKTSPHEHSSPARSTSTMDSSPARSTTTTNSSPVHFTTNEDIPRWTNQEAEAAVSPRPPEVRHIGFLKVHKAASSTMQNMFFRFGAKRNLTFVFTTHPNYFSRSGRNHLPLVPPKKRKGSYDIICNHGIFNKTVYSSLLPNDTVYLGIVRDPLEVFISAVNYYTQKSQSIGYLRKIPGNKVTNLIRYAVRYDRALLSYTRNVMARDFGFRPVLNDIIIENKLDELGSIFKLVLVVEYFDESLILMKRYLSWKMQDILYLPNNVYNKTGYTKADLSPSDVAKFKVRNFLDYKVYDYFHSLFWEQFRSESNDIQDEVLNFKRVLSLLYSFCKGIDRVLIVEETPWNERFKVPVTDCDDMTLDEQVFIRRLRAAQGSVLIRKPRPKAVGQLEVRT